jgi:glycosyltransferase involved in cell wall biosynthesis
MFEKANKYLRQLLNLPAANYRINALEKEVGRLREQLDFFKSSFEVSPQLIEDFQNWKQQTTIPDRPLVSVCIATYNRAELVTQRAIASVLSQTYKHFELIVVGDGCTDDTQARIERMNDPRITFVNLPERGKYPSDPVKRWMVAGTPAMNKSMQLAKGDYITHLDDDDEYLSERIERLVHFSLDQKCDFVWHPFWVNHRDDWLLHEAQSPSLGNLTTGSVFYRSWFKRIEWSLDAHHFMEPGDWNRFRRIKYIQASMMRYDEPLLRHYRQHNLTAHDSFRRGDNSWPKSDK